MAKETKVIKTGPLFEPGATGVFADEITKGLVSLGDETREEAEKRFKKGKGQRTGALKASFSKARKISDLSAGVGATTSAVDRYYHRVEYGSRFMKAQNQRKNARRAVIRSLKNPMSDRSQKVIKRAVERMNG